MHKFGIDNLDNYKVFTYIIITIIILLYFSKLTIGLNIIFGSFIACFIIFYLYNKDKSEVEYEKNIANEKQHIIKPHTRELKKYPKLIDFLFTIQDLYMINPASYQNMVYTLEKFIIIYEELNIDESLVMKNYQTLLLLKNEIINELHSCIFGTSNNNLTDKVNNSIISLSELLDDYLMKAKYIRDKYEFEVGINNETTFITNHPKPKTDYDTIVENNSFYSNKQLYTFDFF